MNLAVLQHKHFLMNYPVVCNVLIYMWSHILYTVDNTCSLQGIQGEFV